MTVNRMKIVTAGESESRHFDQRLLQSPKAILRELYELLEDYSPAWYTEEHHNRAVAALLDRAS